MTESFVSVDVSGWRAAGVEQLGTKPKQWLRDDRDRLWLWKATTTNLSAAGRHAKGDDWAERIVTEIARQLSLPVAMTELAMRAGQPGTVSLSWADRARTRFEGHPHPIEVARSADALVRHGIVAPWTARIEPLDFERLVAQVPADRMSSPAREFALRVGEANRRRILSYPPRTMAT